MSTFLIPSAAASNLAVVLFGARLADVLDLARLSFSADCYRLHTEQKCTSSLR